MTINIEKMRADMRWEMWRFVATAIVALAAAIGAGVGIGNIIWAHQSPSPPQTIILQQPASPRAH